MKLKTVQEKVAELRQFYRWMPERRFRKLIKKMYLANRPTIAFCYDNSSDKGPGGLENAHRYTAFSRRQM
jgi:ribosome-binding factor A